MSRASAAPALPLVRSVHLFAFDRRMVDQARDSNCLFNELGFVDQPRHDDQLAPGSHSDEPPERNSSGGGAEGLRDPLTAASASSRCAGSPVMRLTQEQAHHSAPFPVEVAAHGPQQVLATVVLERRDDRCHRPIGAEDGEIVNASGDRGGQSLRRLGIHHRGRRRVSDERRPLKWTRGMTGAVSRSARRAA